MKEQLPLPEVDEERPSPRVWLGSLDCYNEGILHGYWVNADQDVIDLVSEYARVIDTSPPPGTTEVFIGDLEGFYGLKLPQDTPLDTLSNVAKLVRQYGEPFAHWYELQGIDQLFVTADSFEASYCGQFDGLAFYVCNQLIESGALEEFNEALSNLPETVRDYVNIGVNTVAIDMIRSGDYATTHSSEGKLHIFRLK